MRRRKTQSPDGGVRRGQRRGHRDRRRGAMKRELEWLSGHAMDPAEPDHLRSVSSLKLRFFQHCSITWRKGQGEVAGKEKVVRVEGFDKQLKWYIGAQEGGEGSETRRGEDRGNGSRGGSRAGGTRESLEGAELVGSGWGAEDCGSAPLSLTKHLSFLWHCSFQWIPHAFENLLCSNPNCRIKGSLCRLSPPSRRWILMRLFRQHSHLPSLAVHLTHPFFFSFSL